MNKIYTTDEDIVKFKQNMEYEKNHKYIKLKKSMKKIKNIIFACIVIILVGVLLMVNAIKSEGKVPSFMGFSLYQVETGSMTPTLPVGSIILTKKVSEPKALNKGDVVTFLWDEDIVTHRIIEVVSEEGEVRYKTKGDNPNNGIDPELLHPDKVLAKLVFKLPFTG